MRQRLIGVMRGAGVESGKIGVDMKRAKGIVAVIAMLATAGLGLHAGADEARKTPYFASIAAAKARMRTGPGRTYPASWLYVRPNLPVKVIDTFKEWRKVEDPGGTQGWMLAALVSQQRAAIVNAPAPVEMRAQRGGGAVLWRAAPGVVGKLSQCGAGWCRLDVNGRAGFVEAQSLWGVEPDETLP